MNIKNDRKPTVLPPIGKQIARCIHVVDLGTQESVYKGQVKKQRKVRFLWELPLKKHVFTEEKGEQPFVIAAEHTASMADKANLRKMLEAWIERKFTPDEVKNGVDLAKFISSTAMITISHDAAKSDASKIYANVFAICKVPEGTKVPPMINPKVNFEIGSPNQHQEFEKLPIFLQEKIAKSPEWQAELNGGNSGGEEDFFSSTTKKTTATKKADETFEEENDDVPF